MASQERIPARRHGTAAKVIATVDDLDRIAADDEADVPAMSGWRRERTVLELIM
jgi:ribonuclease D